MSFRTGLIAIIFIAISCLSMGAQTGSETRTQWIETCEHFCYGLIITGRLIDTLEFSKCDAISGMTCRVTLKKGVQFPSRVFMQPLGKKRRLIYPELKAGEGRCTFLGAPSGTNAVVLTGEWNGPYRNPY